MTGMPMQAMTAVTGVPVQVLFQEETDLYLMQHKGQSDEPAVAGVEAPTWSHTCVKTSCPALSHARSPCFCCSPSMGVPPLISLHLLPCMLHPVCTYISRTFLERST